MRAEAPERVPRATPESDPSPEAGPHSVRTWAARRSLLPRLRDWRATRRGSLFDRRRRARWSCAAEKRARTERRGGGIRLALCRSAGQAIAREGGHRLVVHVISPQDALSALLSVGGALGTGLCWDVDRHVARCGGLGVAPWHESRREEIGRCREVVDAPIRKIFRCVAQRVSPCAREMSSEARGQVPSVHGA